MPVLRRGTRRGPYPERGISEPAALAPLADENLRFRIECPKCEHDKDVPPKFLGEQVRCPKCNEEFNAAWGEIAEAKKAERVNDE